MECSECKKPIRHFWVESGGKIMCEDCAVENYKRQYPWWNIPLIEKSVIDFDVKS